MLCNCLVVAQTESTNAVDNQAADEPQASRFTWTIENFSRLNTKKQYSDVFVVGGFKWYFILLVNILVYTCMLIFSWHMT